MSDYIGNVIILRGLPGAGKSTLANLLAGGKENVCEADHYMVDRDGNYSFDNKKLGSCHNRCMDKFKSLVHSAVPTIVVSNTATTRREFVPYYKYAIEHGYKVTVTIVENYHGNSSVHDVPDEAMDRMRDRFQINL